MGTSGTDCGSCDSHVTGSGCDLCEDGYWGLHTLGQCIGKSLQGVKVLTPLYKGHNFEVGLHTIMISQY